ncbi:MAG: hypothetical protein LBI42_05800 [Chitinispirillales bacterium]|jgi:hypothetical protein|nr:hypothetical protein [Chitinispirillales bacterium]
MRLNRLFFCILALSSLVLLFCDRSDVITGAGSSVISDSDSTITNIEMGFSLITLDTDDVDSAFSLPGSASDTFSTQTAGWFMAGVNNYGDTLRAQMQFQAVNNTSGYTKSDTLEGVYLYFRAANDTAASSSINVYQSKPLTGTAPVNTIDVSGPNIGTFKLKGVDSIRINDELADKIFSTRTSITEDTLPFAFSIIDYTGKVRKINSPYVIIRVKKEDGETVVRDSIPGFARFTAFENAGSTDERSAQLYSSQNTLRTAILKIDVIDIIKSANSQGSYRELLNAALSFKHDSQNSNDSAKQYKIVVLDTLITNEAPRDSIESANGLSLQRQFAPVGSSALNSKGNVHSIAAPLRSAINKNREYLYVYLRSTSDHSVILWDKSSIKIEAVLTPSR